MAHGCDVRIVAMGDEEGVPGETALHARLTACGRKPG